MNPCYRRVISPGSGPQVFYVSEGRVGPMRKKMYPITLTDIEINTTLTRVTFYDFVMGDSSIIIPFHLEVGSMCFSSSIGLFPCVSEEISSTEFD